MGRKKRRQKRTVKKGPVRITGASIAGGGIGFFLMGLGLYSALVKGENGGFYVVALGVIFFAAVCWGVWRGR